MVRSLRWVRGVVLAAVGALSLVIAWDVATFGSTSWSADYSRLEAGAARR